MVLVRKRLSFAAVSRNVALFVASAALAACSGAGASPGGAPQVLRFTSDSGAYHVDVTTDSGGAPMRGENTLVLTIADAETGAPASGLTVTMVPFMPAMGHGASITPTVTESPGGKYVATDVDLFMPGTWELRTTIASASATDHVDPEIPIE